MARLQGALDGEVHIAIGKFVENGTAPDVASLYTAIQRSNSSLKRKPKKVLEASIERVLDFMDEQGGSEDSEASIERKVQRDHGSANLMNKNLRATLTPVPQTAPGNPMADANDKKRRLANGEPIAKRARAEKVTPAAPTDLSLDDVGGMDAVIQQLGDNLVLPLLRPAAYTKMKARLPRGILLHGPPGCGKTMLTRAWAAELGLPFIEILGPSIVSGMSGESEKGVRDKFEEAKRNAPCLIFIDELDAIAPKRESSQSQMEKRIVAQLLVSMDELDRNLNKPVMVLAATNRPDSIDPALRRGGRFDTEINIGVPDEFVREKILRAQTREMPLSNAIDFKRLAKFTAGFVGADLHDLVGKAVSCALRRYREALQEQAKVVEDASVKMDMDGATPAPGAISDVIMAQRRLISTLKRTDVPEPPGFEQHLLSMSDFLSVLPTITPSSKREGFATIPEVSWEDIGALKSVREKLQTAIVAPIKNPDIYAAVGISAPTGVLLWGPPGCGKTLLAKAVAAESKANFISVKGPELLNKFVGESEAAVRRVFTRARSSVPCVIFFDELDALCPRRDEGGSEASARVVNTLLTELDGLNERKGIYVVGATNRPDIVDDALLRPGRFATPLFVDLPGPTERGEILRTLLRHRNMVDKEEILELARSNACKGYSGADLGELATEAAHCAIRRQSTRVEVQDFRDASARVASSVGNIEHYYGLKQKLGKRWL